MMANERKMANVSLMTDPIEGNVCATEITSLCIFVFRDRTRNVRKETITLIALWKYQFHTDENTIGPATMIRSTHKTKVSRMLHMDEKYAVGVNIIPFATILIKNSSKKYVATSELVASK